MVKDASPTIDTSEHRAVVRRVMRRVQRGDQPLLVPGRSHVGPAQSMQHFHPHPEVFVQMGGVSRQSFPRGHVDIHVPQVCIIPRWLPHHEEFLDGRTRFRNLVIGFYAGGVWTHIAGARPDGSVGVLRHIGVDLPRAGRLCEYLDDAVEASTETSDAARATVRGSLLAFFGLVSRALAGELRSPPQEPYKITRCRQLIAEHLKDRDLSVGRLAGMIGCSADYLSHLFHTTTGHRLSVYVNAQRVAHAKLLLSTTAMNVSEVAHSCGYADPGYFARQFRRITGETASAYRTHVVSG